MFMTSTMYSVPQIWSCVNYIHRDGFPLEGFVNAVLAVHWESSTETAPCLGSWLGPPLPCSSLKPVFFLGDSSYISAIFCAQWICAYFTLDMPSRHIH
jgi:hypothetical protein